MTITIRPREYTERPRYNLRGTPRQRRVYDWSRHVWRVVTAIDIGRPDPIETVPPAIDELADVEVRQRPPAMRRSYNGKITNTILVHEYIEQHPGLTRGQIVDGTGCKLKAVDYALSRLHDGGHIRREGPRRRPRYYVND